MLYIALQNCERKTWGVLVQSAQHFKLMSRDYMSKRMTLPAPWCSRHTTPCQRGKHSVIDTAEDMLLDLLVVLETCDLQAAPVLLVKQEDGNSTRQHTSQAVR